MTIPEEGLQIPRREFLRSSMSGGIAIAGGPALLQSAAAAASDLAQVLSSKFRRQPIAFLPTPLERLKALGAEIGHANLLIKRDDQTGLATGGNKTRKLEFIIADALQKKADTIVTSAGVQSNWCRQTAAAARMVGMKPVLVLSKRDESPVTYDGNLLLDILFEAEVRIIEPRADRAAVTAGIADELRKNGRNPYLVSVGGSMPGDSMQQPLGAIGYVQAFIELHEQAARIGTGLDAVVLATGSGGTQAGLEVGARAVSPKTRIVGISVSGGRQSAQKLVAEISNATAAALDLKFRFSPEEIVVFDEYVGEGYGKLHQSAADAIRLAAVREGILLDPVYTGKAMAGLVDLVRKGYFRKNETIAFMHTGGAPGIFGYRLDLLKFFGAPPG